MSHTYDEVRRREGDMGLLEKLMYKRKLEGGEAFLALLLEPENILIEREDFDFFSNLRLQSGLDVLQEAIFL